MDGWIMAPRPNYSLVCSYWAHRKTTFLQAPQSARHLLCIIKQVTVETNRKFSLAMMYRNTVHRQNVSKWFKNAQVRSDDPIPFHSQGSDMRMIFPARRTIALGVAQTFVMVLSGHVAASSTLRG
jgi:hypothetical protein